MVDSNGGAGAPQSAEIRTSVLVVGGGPIGLALAADLGRRGIRAMLVEQYPPHTRSARIMLLSIRSMEMCRSFGIAEKIRNWGFPEDYPQGTMWVTDLNGYKLAYVHQDSLKDRKPVSFSPELSMHCPQTIFEPFLRDLAGSFDTVDIRYQTRLEGLEQDGEGVTARVTDLKNDKPITVRADYVVGCDGYGSTVREALGIRMRGLEFIDYSLSIEMVCPNLLELHDKGKAIRYVFVGAEGTWGSMMTVNGRDRWRFLLYGVGKDDVSSIDVHGVIRRAIGRDFKYELDSAKPWVRRGVIADRFQDGRVLLAGDAAHTHLPNGGFGMNTGLSDSVNLGWKLAAVVNGWADPGLLESYDVERRPACHRVMEQALEEFHRFTAPPASPHIEAATPTGDRERREIGADIQKDYEAAHGWDRPGVHLGHIYNPSPVVIPDGSERPVDDTVGHQPSTFPGALAPHVWLDDGRSTLDHFMGDFVLVITGGGKPDTSALAAAAAKRNVPFKTLVIGTAEAAKLYQQPLVLVRPDGHVVWRGAKLPADCLALIDRVRGARAKVARPVAA